MRLRSRLTVWAVVIVAAVSGAAFYCISRPYMFSEAFWQHAHCMPQAKFALYEYAEANDGRFPFHPDGYPQALLLMPNDAPWYALTGPGYEADVFLQAKRNGGPLREEDCGRVYVQGLTLKSNPELALLFDKEPTPGGDHCHFVHRFWARYVRDVLFVDGRCQVIEETEWPAFARRQVELLVTEGFPEREAKRIYRI